MCVFVYILANLNSRSRSLYAIFARPSVVGLSSVCNPRAPYSAGWNFCVIFLRRLVHWPSTDIHWKFYGDRPGETHPTRELNRRGVAKYSDCGPIEGYISETGQYTVGSKLVLFTNRKLYMSFRLVPKSVTLNDTERRNGRYFVLYNVKKTYQFKNLC